MKIWKNSDEQRRTGLSFRGLFFSGQCKIWTADYGLGIKHGLGYKTRTEHYGLGVKYGLRSDVWLRKSVKTCGNLQLQEFKPEYDVETGIYNLNIQWNRDIFLSLSLRQSNVLRLYFFFIWKRSSQLEGERPLTFILGIHHNDIGDVCINSKKEHFLT